MRWRQVVRRLYNVVRRKMSAGGWVHRDRKPLGRVAFLQVAGGSDIAAQPTNCDPEMAFTNFAVRFAIKTPPTGSVRSKLTANFSDSKYEFGGGAGI
jgi:hypothetical protein